VTTTRPEAVAAAVRKLSAARGYGPTVSEIGDHLRLDPSAALRAVRQAEAAGVIERRRGCPRAIRAVDRGELRARK
jgi:DNA-binding MarR family transcriptional regulator